MTKGTLFVIAAPSGAGKTTLLQAVLERANGKLKRVVTSTTRPQRPNEVNGVHYHFYDEGQFWQRIKDGAFLEHATVHGNFYGVQFEHINKVLDSGHNCALILDIQGSETLRLKGIPCVRIFIMPPDIDTLMKRLIDRGDTDDIERRMQVAQDEMNYQSQCDHVVINGAFDEAVDNLASIMLK